MSEANVDVVRRVYEAAIERDRDAVLALYDPDVELDTSGLLVIGGGFFRGHDGLRKLFRDWNDAWGQVDYRLEELIDTGGDDVISVVTRHGTGKTSGVAVELHAALLWTVRSGMVVRVEWFRTREDALAAAGRG